MCIRDRCVNIPSYLVKAGDVIEIKEKHKGDTRYKMILDVTAGRLIPAWLEVDQAVSYTHLDVYKRQE